MAKIAEAGTRHAGRAGCLEGQRWAGHWPTLALATPDRPGDMGGHSALQLARSAIMIDPIALRDCEAPVLPPRLRNPAGPLPTGSPPGTGCTDGTEGNRAGSRPAIPTPR